MLPDITKIFTYLSVHISLFFPPPQPPQLPDFFFWYVSPFFFALRDLLMLPDITKIFFLKRFSHISRCARALLAFLVQKYVLTGTNVRILTREELQAGSALLVRTMSMQVTSKASKFLYQ